MDKLIFRENVYSDYSIKLTKDWLALDLTNYTIKFKMFDLQNVKLIDKIWATIGDATNWEFTYAFDSVESELAVKGKYKGYFIFELWGVAKLSYPESWYIEIRVENDFIA